MLPAGALSKDPAVGVGYAIYCSPDLEGYMLQFANCEINPNYGQNASPNWGTLDKIYFEYTGVNHN